MRSQMKTLSDNQGFLSRKVDEEKATVAEKNKEIRSLTLELEVVKKKSEAIDSELTQMRVENAELKSKVEELSRKQREHEQELANSNQAGYDQCFEEKLVELRKLRQVAYQLGYDFGLTSAGISHEGPLRVEVVAPPLPVDEVDEEDAEEDGDDVADDAPMDLPTGVGIDDQTAPDQPVEQAAPPNIANPPNLQADSPLAPLAHELSGAGSGAVEDVVAVD